MTDYYAVLKKAVSGFESESGDARRSVYDKARTALIGQLKSIDPPLTTSEISRQRLELEEAIRKVEREASAARPTPVRVSAAAAVAEALAVPEEPAEPEYADEPEDDLEAEVVHPTPPPVPPVAAARPRPAPAASVPPPAPIPPPPPIPEPQDDVLDAEDYHGDDEPGREPEWHEPDTRQAPPVQPQWPQIGRASCRERVL